MQIGYGLLCLGPRYLITAVVCLCLVVSEDEIVCLGRWVAHLLNAVVQVFRRGWVQLRSGPSCPELYSILSTPLLAGYIINAVVQISVIS